MEEGVGDVTGFKLESFRADHAGWPPPSQAADGDTRVAPDALMKADYLTDENAVGCRN
jgi:hypothetical protein